MASRDDQAGSRRNGIQRMRIMDGTASTTEQQHYAQRLIAAGQRLHRRADGPTDTVIDGEVLTTVPVALPAHIVDLDRAE